MSENETYYNIPISATVVEAIVAEHLAHHPYSNADEANDGEFVFDNDDDEVAIMTRELLEPFCQAEVVYLAMGDAAIPPAVFKKALASLVQQGRAFKYKWSNATTFVPCEPETDRGILRALVRFEDRYHAHLEQSGVPCEAGDDAYYACYEFCRDALDAVPHVGYCHGTIAEMMDELEEAVPCLVSLPAWVTLWRRVDPDREREDA